MGRKNFVYEEILKEYTAIRESDLQKISTARDKIAEATSIIAENEKLMKEATKDGDAERYEALRAVTLKQEEIKKFYNGVLAAVNQAPSDPAEAKKLVEKATAEIEEVKKAYNKDMIEALKPLIEISKKAYTQIYLLEMAKQKIMTNVLHSKYLYAVVPGYFFNLNLMSRLDGFLQDQDYKENTPELTGTDKLTSTRNYWNSAADKAVQKESEKWK